MILIAIAGVILAVLYCLAEAWYERDFPRKMARYVLIFAGLAVACVSAFGQGTYVSGQALTVSRSVPSGQSAPVMTLPRAQVFVCLPVNLNCNIANSVTVYQDVALTQPLAQPLFADALGNFGYYIGPGQFKYSVYSTIGALIETYPFTTPATIASLPSDAILAANTTAILGSVGTAQTIPNLIAPKLAAGDATANTLNAYQLGEYLIASRPSLHGWMNALHYAGTVQQHIIWMNTSFSRCDQTICGTGPDIEAHRVPSIVRDDLANRYGYGVPGHGMVPVRSVIGDSRIDNDYYTTSVSTSVLTNDCRLGPQQLTVIGRQCTVVKFPASAVLTFASRIPIDRVGVDCMTDATSGAWSISIDGGSASSVCGTNTSSATAIRQEVAAAGYALHTAVATCSSSAPCYMWAMEGLGGTTGIVVDNVSFGTCSSRCYGSDPNAAFAWIDQIPGAGYALRVYENGTNEPGIAVPVNETLTNTGNVFAHHPGSYVGYPSNLIVTPPIGSITGVPPYVAALNAYATANKIALVSITSQWGATYSAADPAWTSDGSHPSEVGTANEAAQIEAQIFDALPQVQAGRRIEITSATTGVISPYADIFITSATSAPTITLPTPLTAPLAPVGATLQVIGKTTEVEIKNFASGSAVATLTVPTGWTLLGTTTIANGARVTCTAYQQGSTKNWLCN